MSAFHSTSSLKLSSFGFDSFHSNSRYMSTPNLWCFSNSNHRLYGSTNPSHRRNLWQVLINSSTTTLPWCVLGDCNATLAHDEKLNLRNPQFILTQKLKALKQSLKLWHKTTFGNIHSNIHAAESIVLSCQQSFDPTPSTSLWNDLMFMKLDLHEALKAKEIHWKQCSQITWLKEGDQNIKFFHQPAKARSSFNSINHISVNGIRSDGPLIIQAQAMPFFSNLYKPHDG
ncbi:hypothetical protein AAC387_Pa07g2240 [Persea americana]